MKVKSFPTTIRSLKELQMNQVLCRHRSAIDKIDDQIVNLIAKRFVFVGKISAYKAAKRLPPCDPTREKRILERLVLQCNKYALDPQLVASVFKLIFQYSKRNHARIAHAQRRNHHV